ncbi:3-hydroxyacyl-CoA dehydrogenase NAD-binding domain-containing protein [Dactylosporangium sp. NPDC051484]|uniref:3-hydroxyacyl-CoA dehydrogenase NAD-binding domain-containing protein n=1 Tax=Dactylosporangium sp. NPDC051484 TaxID=3154942 RepID=UPI00344D9F0B
MELDRVAVRGAGTIGTGIAQLAASCGHQVVVAEPSRDGRRTAQATTAGVS